MHRFRRLPVGVFMFGDHIRVNAAPHIEVRPDTHEVGMNCRGDVIENFVRDRFMKCAPVTEGPHIEFERFEFDAELIRNIFYR